MCEQLGGTHVPIIVYERMDHVDGSHLHKVAREVAPKSKAAKEITEATEFILKTMEKEVKKNGKA